MADRPDEGPSLPTRWKPSAFRAISSRMTKLEKIEQDIASLSPGEVAKLARWFAEFQADLWDKQMEEDAKSGKLDKLFAEAEADIAAGKIRPL